MNELHPAAAGKPPRRLFSWRQLIYLMAIAGVVTTITVMFPAQRTVRMALRVAPESRSVMRVSVPEKCRISAFYLRVRGEVSATGELFELKLNDQRDPVGDIGSLKAAAAAPAEAGTRNFLLPAVLPPGTAGAVWRIGFDRVRAGLGDDTLELVVEVTGPAAQLERWSEIVTLENEGTEL